MQTKLLFPHRYRRTGWIIFTLSALVGLYCFIFEVSPKWLVFDVPDWMPNSAFPLLGPQNQLDLTLTILITGVLVGLLLVAFSREEVEDEMIAQLRLESLQWALWVNYAVLLAATLFVYNVAYLHVMEFNMFTPLLVFIVRFRWLLRRARKEEEVAA